MELSSFILALTKLDISPAKNCIVNENEYSTIRVREHKTRSNAQPPETRPPSNPSVLELLGMIMVGWDCGSTLRSEFYRRITWVCYSIGTYITINERRLYNCGAYCNRTVEVVIATTAQKLSS